MRSLFWFDIFVAINTAENTVRPEKSNLVSGNRPGGIFFYPLPAYIVECVSEYTFLIPKNKQRQESKKAKEIKEEKRISPENRLKKNKLAAARVKNFLVICISGKKSIFCLT